MKVHSIIISLLILIPVVTNAQRFRSTQSDDTLDYSSLKYQAFNLHHDHADNFKIFDSIVDLNHVFFIGENHTYRLTNSNLQLAFIKYLHERVGLRHVVMEFGYARSWLVDKYINSEDSSYGLILKRYSFPEYYYYYKDLRKYNLSLPDSSRIHVYGIDVERFNDTPLKVLSMLLPEEDAPDSIALNVEALRGIAGFLDDYRQQKLEDFYEHNDGGFSNFRSYSRFSSSKTAEVIVKDFMQHKKYYKDYLGDSSYVIFEQIIQELKDQDTYQSYSRTPHQHVFRENYMYQKFLEYHARHPQGKFFGQFGRCHVAASQQSNPCSWYEFKSIVNRINMDDNPWLNDKVAAIAYFYSDDNSYSKSFHQGGNLEKVFQHVRQKDTIVAIQVSEDSVLFGDFHQYYDFVIYDRRTLEESVEGSVVEELYSEDSETEGNFSFYFGWQRLDQDVSDFNNYLVQNNFSTLNTQVDKIVFGIQVNSLSGFCFSWNGFGHVQQDLANPIDTLSINYTQGGMMMDFGWNLLNSKHVFLKPQLGMGFTGAQVRINQTQEKQDVDFNFFGGRTIENFYTGTFLLDPSIEIIFKYKFLGVGAKSGYLLSPFSSKWRNSNGDRIELSPDFFSTGFYVQANLFMMFDF
jgi:hypothetical protein